MAISTGIVSRIIDREPGLCQDPRTADEWRMFIMIYPSTLVTAKLPAGKGCSHVPGSTLLRITKGGMAVVVPPGHTKEIEVRLNTIRLWKKGHEERLKQNARRTLREKVVQMPKVTVAEDLTAEQAHYVLDPETNRLLSVSRSAARGADADALRWTNNFTQASRFMNRHRANIAAYNYRITRRERGGMDLVLSCLPAKDAMARFPATNVDDAFAIEPEVLEVPPEAISEPMPPREEPLKPTQASIAAPQKPDLIKSVPIPPSVAQESPKPPAQTVVLGRAMDFPDENREVTVISPGKLITPPNPLVAARTEWAAAIRELALAEGMVMNAKGRLVAAEAELKIAECQCGTR